MKLKDKANWTQVYVEETPGPYMQFSLQNEYVVPEYSMRYIRPLLNKLYSDRQDPVKIMDLGASYGIIATLVLYDITWQSLIDFYVEHDEIKEHSWHDIMQFYHNPIHGSKYAFYLADTSQPAMQFAEQVGLCEKAFTLDLKHDTLIPELKQAVEQTDVFTVVGAFGYIGNHFFEQMLDATRKKECKPLISLSIYPLVFHGIFKDRFEALLQEYGYRLVCCRKPDIGHRMTTDERTALFRDSKYKQDPACQFEENGYYTSLFYLAMHESQHLEFSAWLTALDETF